MGLFLKQKLACQAAEELLRASEYTIPLSPVAG